MAQARPVVEVARVAIVAPGPLGETALAALRLRGIAAEIRSSAEGEDLVGWAFEGAPSAMAVVDLALACADAAMRGQPICVLAPLVRGTGRVAIERAASLAYLRAHGAALAHDVDAWLEALVLLARFGLPPGPRAAVIAPAGSWLAAQHHAIVAEAELSGTRPLIAGDDEPTDVVLYDPELGRPPASTPGMHVPVVPRAELAADASVPALFGARTAALAISMLGQAAERATLGLGPAPKEASAELALDHERLQRQLVKIGQQRLTRAGDHETKVLLAAYQVPHTRQGVATTPSAAVTMARKIGYPVELKPYGNDVPSEPGGCPVEREVSSDALVRRAYGAVLGASARQDGVIVREAPPSGRDLSVSLVKLPALGWTVVLDVPGGVAAAPAPLRLVDANALAAGVVSSRAGDPDVDRAGLANVLRRASHLVVDLDARISRLDLPRVVVGGRGARTVVVDASCELI